MLGVALLASCSPRPNVVLVTFDTTRYDRFGCTGDAEARTPVVDALAERGLLFDRAYASVPLTLPAHTTILTGLDALGHGVHQNGRFRVSDALDTLAEILRGHGYATAAFVSAFVLDPRYNLDQGFEVYGAESRRNSDPLDSTVPQRPGAEVTEDALAWLEARSDDTPFFLWAHYYDPHAPRSAEPPFDAMSDGYRAEIAYADAQLGRLLEGVEKASPRRDTLVVFTADHGEGLGDHGELTHGILAYDSTLHVPLILAGAGVPSAERSDVLARHVDIVPTILERLDLPVSGDLPGRDLLRAATDPTQDYEIAYFESRGAHLDLGWAPIAGVRTRDWKYTASPRPEELYSMRNDPGEKRNLARRRSDIAAFMAALLAGLQQSRVRPDLAGEGRTPDAEEWEQLAALGYVDVNPASGGQAPDPRELVVVHSWVSQARALARAGRFDRAIEMLETLEESASVRALVVSALAPIYVEVGRLDDAIRTYRSYAELTASPEPRIGLARSLMRAERLDEGLAVLDQISPTSTRVQMLRATALSRLGRRDEARRVVDAAFAGEHREQGRLHARSRLVLDVAPIPDGEAELRALAAAAPDDPLLKSRLGLYLAVWGSPERSDEAIELLRAAGDAAPDRAEMQSSWGRGLLRAGHADEAGQAFEAALVLDATRHPDRVRLAGILRRTGERERALELLRASLAARPAASWSEDARSLAVEIESELQAAAVAGARS